jgi:hypothetical protein
MSRSRIPRLVSTGNGIEIRDASWFELRRVVLREHAGSALWVVQSARLTPMLVANAQFIDSRSAIELEAEGTHAESVPVSIQSSLFSGNYFGLQLSYSLGTSAGNSEIDVDRSVFRANDTGIQGSRSTPPAIRVTNSVFGQNGFALFGATDVANSTFANNRAAVVDNRGAIVNSILWDNDTEIADSPGTVSHPLVQDLELDIMLDGGEVFSADPLLDADLHLQTGSPAIDRGSNPAALALGIAGGTDIDGETRSRDAAAAADGPDGFIDLGADESPGADDEDGDAVIDEADNCRIFPNPPQLDGDANGIGDACECGDQSGDGTVDVSDLVAINRAVFDPAVATPLCDTNGDDLCDVRDIVGANRKIFGGFAVCSRYGPLF